MLPACSPLPPPSWPDQESSPFHMGGIERELWEFAAFYRLQMASVKTAAYHHMRAGEWRGRGREGLSRPAWTLTLLLL